LASFPPQANTFQGQNRLRSPKDTLCLSPLRWLNLAISKSGLGENLSAIPLYTEAIDLYLRLGFVAQAGNNLGNLGNSYFTTGDYARAKQCFSEALRIAKEASDRNGIARACAGIANIAAAGGDYHVALDAFKQALEVAQKNGDVQAEAKYQAGMALALQGLGDNSSAIRSYMLALDKARQIADRQEEASILVAVGSLLGKSGDLHRGLSLLEQGLTISNQIGDQLTCARASGNLGT
jgi:tetratricopeptide (TPR) repeat protein